MSRTQANDGGGTTRAMIEKAMKQAKRVEPTNRWDRRLPDVKGQEVLVISWEPIKTQYGAGFVAETVLMKKKSDPFRLLIDSLVLIEQVKKWKLSPPFRATFYEHESGESRIYYSMKP